MAAELKRGTAERAAAWIWTGPPGHLYGTLADIVAVWARVGYAYVRTRSASRPRPSSRR